jgi:hypothetical protein
MITEILRAIRGVVGNVHDMIDEAQKTVDISTDHAVHQTVNKRQCIVHGHRSLIDVDEHVGETVQNGTVYLLLTTEIAYMLQPFHISKTYEHRSHRLHMHNLSETHISQI